MKVLGTAGQMEACVYSATASSSDAKQEFFIPDSLQSVPLHSLVGCLRDDDL